MGPTATIPRSFMNICRESAAGETPGRGVVKRHFHEIRRLTRVASAPPRLSEELWNLLDGLMSLEPRARLTMAQARAPSNTSRVQY